MFVLFLFSSFFFLFLDRFFFLLLSFLGGFEFGPGGTSPPLSPPLPPKPKTHRRHPPHACLGGRQTRQGRTHARHVEMETCSDQTTQRTRPHYTSGPSLSTQTQKSAIQCHDPQRPCLLSGLGHAPPRVLGRELGEHAPRPHRGSTTPATFKALEEVVSLPKPEATRKSRMTTHYETSVILMGRHTLFSDSGARPSRH